VKNCVPFFFQQLIYSDLWQEIMRAGEPTRNVSALARQHRVCEQNGRSAKAAAYILCAQILQFVRHAQAVPCSSCGKRPDAAAESTAAAMFLLVCVCLLQWDAEVRDRALSLVEDFARGLPMPAYKEAYGSLWVSCSAGGSWHSSSCRAWSTDRGNSKRPALEHLHGRHLRCARSAMCSSTCSCAVSVTTQDRGVEFPARPEQAVDSSAPYYTPPPMPPAAVAASQGLTPEDRAAIAGEGGVMQLVLWVFVGIVVGAGEQQGMTAQVLVAACMCKSVTSTIHTHPPTHAHPLLASAIHVLQLLSPTWRLRQRSRRRGRLHWHHQGCLLPDTCPP
jgi:hypothetical protein